MFKKIFNGQVMLALALIFLSVAFYLICYVVFHDARYIFMTVLSNIGFAFFEVFLVTLVIHRLLLFRERRALLRKMNMVIGIFFIELGTDLIRACSKFDANAASIIRQLASVKDLSGKEFDDISRVLRKYNGAIDYAAGDVPALKDLLAAKRGFLLTLLGNANLLEHDSFTNLLWATFHLTDELSRRKDLRALPETDQKHIAIDINRTYGACIIEWLAYMKHLKSHYPYLFSFAMRTNPFDAAASVEVV
ncbi:MAG: hypothetical protein HQL17_00920 [Candidatus Omnitrophica bacterium]|nr:hypothetical protein [Candidatus Omnitrophota bacterium]